MAPAVWRRSTTLCLNCSFPLFLVCLGGRGGGGEGKGEGEGEGEETTVKTPLPSPSHSLFMKHTRPHYELEQELGSLVEKGRGVIKGCGILKGRGAGKGHVTRYSVGHTQQPPTKGTYSPSHQGVIQPPPPPPPTKGTPPPCLSSGWCPASSFWSHPPASPAQTPPSSCAPGV